MNINFKKISATLASIAMLGSTAGIAAAANYPAPFIVNGGLGTGGVAVVYGQNAVTSDVLQSSAVSTDLQSRMGTSSGGTDGDSTSGETYAIFGGTKIYINDSMNKVKSSITKSQLPVTLADETFSGNVDAKITNTISLETHPKLVYAKQPTSSDDPILGFALGTNGQTQPIYNATASFNKAVALNVSDSEGEEIILFGQTFTVATETDSSKIVLLKTAQKVFLSSDSNPSQQVTISGETYTVDLAGATDTSATIKVTKSDGTTAQKEISEAASKKVNGLTIAVNTADESTALNSISAEIVAGAEKVSLTNGSSVQIGEDDSPIDGTHVTFGDSDSGPGAITRIRIATTTGDSDLDALFPGSSFVDPTSSNFKIDLAGYNIDEDSSDREDIIVKHSGDDKMEITFSDHTNNKLTNWRYATNVSTSADIQLQNGDSEGNISVIENEILYRKGYVVVGNEEEGHLVKISSVINNSGTSYSSDKVQFTDAFSGTVYETSITSKGSGTVTIGGKDYSVTYSGASGNSDTVQVTLNYPDSSGNDKIVYPTIETSKGANLFFYKPLTINVTREGLAGANIRFPDGDGYTNAAVGSTTEGTNVTIGGGISLNLSAADGTRSSTVSIGRLSYNFTSSGAVLTTKLFLRTVGGANIVNPAIVIFEEEDDDNDYEVMIVTLEPGGTSDDGLGVSDVERTWDTDNTAWEFTLASNSDIKKEIDLWGSIVTTDSTDSDQAWVKISYPDEQIYAKVYVGSADSSVTTSGGGSTGVTQLGNILVDDSEISSVQSKNLIVIGGSCINSVAANLLGGALCGADFTTKTGAGSGEYVIQSFGDAYTTGRIALLVAGYNAQDTVNAATYLVNNANAVDTAAGKKYKGTTATSASMVTTTA